MSLSPTNPSLRELLLSLSNTNLQCLLSYTIVHTRTIFSSCCACYSADACNRATSMPCSSFVAVITFHSYNRVQRKSKQSCLLSANAFQQFVAKVTHFEVPYQSFAFDLHNQRSLSHISGHINGNEFFKLHTAKSCRFKHVLQPSAPLLCRVGILICPINQIYTDDYGHSFFYDR